MLLTRTWLLAAFLFAVCGSGLLCFVRERDYSGNSTATHQPLTFCAMCMAITSSHRVKYLSLLPYHTLLSFLLARAQGHGTLGKELCFATAACGVATCISSNIYFVPERDDAATVLELTVSRATKNSTEHYPARNMKISAPRGGVSQPKLPPRPRATQHLPPTVAAVTHLPALQSCEGDPGQDNRQRTHIKEPPP